MEPDELLSTARQSEALLRDELAHQGQGCPDPSSAIGSAITDSDLAAMRSKFPFLRDFSDSFIRATKPDCILKMESTTLKIKEPSAPGTRTTSWPQTAPHWAHRLES